MICSFLSVPASTGPPVFNLQSPEQPCPLTHLIPVLSSSQSLYIPAFVSSSGSMLDPVQVLMRDARPWCLKWMKWLHLVFTSSIKQIKSNISLLNKMPLLKQSTQNWAKLKLSGLTVRNIHWDANDNIFKNKNVLKQHEQKRCRWI